MSVSDPLCVWSKPEQLSVTPLLKDAEYHSIHAYFNASPESPDGRFVIFFKSQDPKGHMGEICILDRESGTVETLATIKATEDAHRVAMQQWISGGRRIVFHDFRDGEWVVVVIDLDSRTERILAHGRQIGFGQPNGDMVPLYGPHWAPGEYRDLELLDVETGEIHKVLTWQSIKDAYPQWVAKQFADRPISIFFPLLSPDAKRVLFKVATPGTGIFQTKGDSEREGLLCYDLQQQEYLWLRERWGHPGWTPDGKTVINVGPILINADTGALRECAKFPKFPWSHPSLAPDGRLFVTDSRSDEDGHPWTVVVGDLQTGNYHAIYTFDNSLGADSWRKNHPHPIFSPDGKRIYFNVGSQQWTRLFVAEYKG